MSIFLFYIIGIYSEQFSDQVLKYTTISEKSVLVGTDEEENGNALVDTSVKEIIIPSYVTNQDKSYVVTTIGTYAFRFNNQITKITISNTVQEIKVDAIAHMSNLKEVIIEKGSQLSRLKRGFLYDTKVSTFTLPPSVSYIDIKAFGETQMNWVMYCGYREFTETDIFTDDDNNYNPPSYFYVSQNYMFSSFGKLDLLTPTSKCNMYFETNIYHGIKDIKQ